MMSSVQRKYMKDPILKYFTQVNFINCCHLTSILLLQGNANPSQKKKSLKPRKNGKESLFPNIFQTSIDNLSKPKFEQEFTFRKPRIQYVSISLDNLDI